MNLDPLILARLQFALTIMFHYLFPPLTIGLGWIMVYMEGRYLKTGDKEYESIARFLTGIFAVVFAVGVASGIVMEFQFGTNWQAYSEFVGDVFGAALAAEGIFAFFLESGFLAVLVFGWDRVGPKMHFFSSIMVAVGALFSSVWITVANSWQQTPAGHHFVEHMGKMRAETVDFWQVVFNPSTVHRLVHVWIGCGILGAFFVLSISAYYILKGRHESQAKKMFKAGLALGLVMSVAAPISGHFQGQNVAKHQPVKLAAFEGLFETPEGGADMYAIGWPDEEAEKVRMGIPLPIPGMLSFLVHEDFTTPVKGLDNYAKEDWPPVWISFQSFHIMIACGLLFILLTAVGSVMAWRGTLWKTRWLLWVFVFAVPLPFVANELGWVAAEVGRQPFVVYPEVDLETGELVAGTGMRTADGVSVNVSGGQILFSIIMFGLVYALLFAIFIYVLDKKIRKGPEYEEPVPHGHKGGFREAAAAYASHGGPSMTGVRNEEDEEDEADSNGADDA